MSEHTKRPQAWILQGAMISADAEQLSGESARLLARLLIEESIDEIEENKEAVNDDASSNLPS